MLKVLISHYFEKKHYILSILIPANATRSEPVSAHIGTGFEQFLKSDFLEKLSFTKMQTLKMLQLCVYYESLILGAHRQ